MAHSFQMACHECDLLNRIGAVPHGAVARCARCGALLWRPRRNSLERTLAFAVTGLILFVIANVYPFLGFKVEAQVRQTALTTGVIDLYGQGLWPMATLVLLTCVLIPAFELLGTLYVILPLRLNRRTWRALEVFRIMKAFQPWAMMEVFMLGILVSVVKLAKMATILPGLSLYAFMTLIFVLAATRASLDAHIVWEGLDQGNA
jgi:paraquat-inducible protein A